MKLVHLSQGQKCDKEYFANEILEVINKECTHGPARRMSKTMKMHMSNSRIHNTLETAEKIGEMEIERLGHLMHSPDLSPCDFWVVGRSR
jgi:hypothetical protein